MSSDAARSRRRSPSQSRSKATVDTILEATARVLVEDGYDGASTNRIAQVAGVSVGSVYQYFPSKESIIDELIERQASAALGVVMEKLAEVAGRPLEEAARAVVGALFDAFARDVALNKVLLEQMPRTARMRKLREIEARGAQAVRVALELHRARLRVTDLDTAALLLVHFVDVIADAITVARPEQIADGRLRDEVTQMILRYLLP